MAPLTALLYKLGYDLVVPDGPHRTTGAADGIAVGALDEADSFGWWTYDGESHHAAPIGLDASLAALRSLGKFAGVVGFSQGGAMAAQVANAVDAEWAVLFSPVYCPGHAAQCDCPTLVAFDRADDVMECTDVLLGELPAASCVRLEHAHGHRLPPDSDPLWPTGIAPFLEERSA